jgi:hypothetical protein
MERTVSLDLETALKRAAPTRTQWDAWIRREASLAGLTYGDPRRLLRTGCQDRKDELLGALVRATHADPGAFGVVAACLLPGLRRRVARYAPSLDRREALAVIVDADGDRDPAIWGRCRRGAEESLGAGYSASSTAAISSIVLSEGRRATLFASVEDRAGYARAEAADPLGRGYRGASRSALSIA